jgi:hypothetical protein
MASIVDSLGSSTESVNTVGFLVTDLKTQNSFRFQRSSRRQARLRPARLTALTHRPRTTSAMVSSIVFLFFFFFFFFFLHHKVHHGQLSTNKMNTHALFRATSIYLAFAILGLLRVSWIWYDAQRMSRNWTILDSFGTLVSPVAIFRLITIVWGITPAAASQEPQQSAQTPGQSADIHIPILESNRSATTCQGRPPPKLSSITRPSVSSQSRHTSVQFSKARPYISCRGRHHSELHLLARSSLLRQGRPTPELTNLTDPTTLGAPCPASCSQSGESSGRDLEVRREVEGVVNRQTEGNRIRQSSINRVKRIGKYVSPRHRPNLGRLKREVFPAKAVLRSGSGVILPFKKSMGHVPWAVRSSVPSKAYCVVKHRVVKYINVKGLERYIGVLNSRREPSVCDHDCSSGETIRELTNQVWPMPDTLQGTEERQLALPLAEAGQMTKAAYCFSANPSTGVASTALVISGFTDSAEAEDGEMPDVDYDIEMVDAPPFHQEAVTSYPVIPTVGIGMDTFVDVDIAEDNFGLDGVDDSLTQLLIKELDEQPKDVESQQFNGKSVLEGKGAETAASDVDGAVEVEGATSTASKTSDAAEDFIGFDDDEEEEEGEGEEEEEEEEEEELLLASEVLRDGEYRVSLVRAALHDYPGQFRVQVAERAREEWADMEGRLPPSMGRADYDRIFTDFMVEVAHKWPAVFGDRIQLSDVNELVDRWIDACSLPPIRRNKVILKL